MTLTSAFSFGVSWFVKSRIDLAEKANAKIMSGYFHSGDGSEDDPFVITRPVHYENMHKLNNQYEETFSKNEYHFQFGIADEGSDDYYFYGYGSDGKTIDTDVHTKILDLKNITVKPIGTSEFPFTGYLEGNDLSVQNFKIDGNGRSDIGIFGFVKSTTYTKIEKDENDQNVEVTYAPIHNCYWRNFIIDTSGSTTVHKHDLTNNPSNAHYDSDNSAEVGYLAGHVVNTESFENCYINNASVKAKGGNAKANTTYGYFGMAENDYLGGKTAKGNNYEFKLDSEAIYRSTRQRYDDIADNPIRVRSGDDQITEYTTPLNGDNEEIVDGSAKYPFSSAMSRAKAWDNNDTYTIEGKTPNNKNAARNYTYSSIGYQDTTTNTTPLEYEVYYKKNNTNQYMPKDTIYKSDWKSPQSLSSLTAKGDYYYHDGTNWKYIHSENVAGAETGKKSFTINVTDHPEVTFTGFAGLGLYGSVDYAHGYFYIDNQLIHDEDVKSRISVNPSSIQMVIKNVGFKTKTFTANLTRGKHYFEYYFVVRTKTTTTSWGTSYRYVNSWYSNKKNSIDNTSGGNLSITAGTFEVTQELYDKATVSERKLDTFSCTDHSHRNKSDSVEGFNLTNDTRAATSSDIPQYINSNTFEAQLYGLNRRDGSEASLSSASLQWRKEEGETLNEDGTKTPWHKWIAYNTPPRTIDTTADPYFLSSNPDITPKYNDDGSYTSGYQWNNLDIVGGGVSFYYRNFPLLDFDVRVVSIPAENSSNYVCDKIPIADINSGAKFYASKYCPCSIVMYFKNTANAADTHDHTLGDIDFTYANASAFGSSFVNLSVPSFKKGAGEFLDLSDFGMKSGEGLFDYETTYTGSITESAAKKCSYCALDADGKILGEFNADGTAGRGLLKNGQPDTEKLLKIDTYVVVLGSNSNIVNSTWITRINFNYVTVEGYGGVFGSVEYRDQAATATETIFTFFINVPANSTYYINIIYREEAFTVGSQAYSGKNYFITFFSETTLTMNAFLYNSSYRYTFNGNEYSVLKTGLTSSKPPTGFNYDTGQIES